MATLPHEKHDDALADVIWWLKGYSAASEPNHDVDAMLRNLRSLRTWLLRLGESDWAQPARVLGTDRDDLRIVMTETEFDRINDGVIANTEGERTVGLHLMASIREQYIAELKQDETPF